MGNAWQALEAAVPPRWNTSHRSRQQAVSQPFLYDNRALCPKAQDTLRVDSSARPRPLKPSLQPRVMSKMRQIKKAASNSNRSLWRSSSSADRDSRAGRARRACTRSRSYDGCKAAKERADAPDVIDRHAVGARADARKMERLEDMVRAKHCCVLEEKTNLEEEKNT